MTLLMLLGWLLALRGVAEPARVAIWSLSGLAGNTNDSRSLAVAEERLREAAAVLKKADLDIIVLQHVPNRIACQKLTDYLNPALYQIAVCSEFLDGASGDQRPAQLAILSRQPVLAVWSDHWKSLNSSDQSRGYVFAAVQHGDQVVGVYSVEFKDNTIKGNPDLATQLNILQRERAAEQLVREIGSISLRFKSTIDAFVIAGNFNTDPDEARFVSENTLHAFEEAGITNAFQNLPLEQRITSLGDGERFATTLAYVLGKNVAVASPPIVLSNVLAGPSPVMVDLEVQAAPFVAGTVPLAAPYADKWTVWLMTGIFVLVSVLCFFLWRLNRWSATNALVPARLPAPGTVSSIIACPNCEEPIAVTPDGSGTLQPILLAELTDESLRQEGLKDLKPGDQTKHLMRERLIPHLARLLMNKLVGALIFQRRDLLKTQRQAATQVNELEDRLRKLPPRLQDRLRAYERRIVELEKDLADKGEENRELIRAQIVLVKKELAEEKSRNRLEWN